MVKTLVAVTLLVSMIVPAASQATQPVGEQSSESASNAHTHSHSAIAAAPTPLDATTPTTQVFAYRDIDETREAVVDPATGLANTVWAVYEDIMFPGTAIEWEISHVTSPARTGSAFKCAITGGDQYNNIFCNTTIAKRWREAAWPYHTAKRLVYTLWFYVDGTIDCNAPNRSTIEGLEFGWQSALIPLKHEFAVQWSKGGRWRYWDASINRATGRPKAWTEFPSPINTCFLSHTWHQLQFESYILGDGSYYKAMRLDGTTYDLKNAHVGRAETPPDWHEHFLQVSVQINGNTALDSTRRVDSVAVYVDQVHLEGFAQPSVFLPTVQR